LHFAFAPEDHLRLSDFAAFGPLRWAEGRFVGSDREAFTQQRTASRKCERLIGQKQ
jgi:hypothetical protein